MTLTICQIVPRLPPAIDGVGDYAINLARQLRKDFDVQTHFLVANLSWSKESTDSIIEGFPVTYISDSSTHSLVKELSNLSCSVLLHYVGYGYARRGCPVWLVDGLQRWKSLHSNRSLVTMFHEIYASSNKPWQSSFWLSPLQKHLAKQLVQISDQLVTSNITYAKILEKFSNGNHSYIYHLPVFSNIGEPSEIPQLSQRERNLIIFGSRASRKRAYVESQEFIQIVCRHLNIDQVLDIGTPILQSQSYLGSTLLKVLGELSAEEISSILLNSLAGFINYDPNFLAKSTIFASYCSHGILPIHHSIQEIRGFNNSIQPNLHYLSVKDLLHPERFYQMDNLETIATNAYQWYHNHSLAKQSKVFYELCF